MGRGFIFFLETSIDGTSFFRIFKKFKNFKKILEIFKGSVDR